VCVRAIVRAHVCVCVRVRVCVCVHVYSLIYFELVARSSFLVYYLTHAISHARTRHKPLHTHKQTYTYMLAIKRIYAHVCKHTLTLVQPRLTDDGGSSDDDDDKSEAAGSEVSKQGFFEVCGLVPLRACMCQQSQQARLL